MESKKVRNIKVISQSGRNYKPTPTVILKGQWLNEMGFEIGDQIKVECENGKLVISLDRERMEMLDAEKVFMEEETKKLQARFKKEKEEIHARYVYTVDSEYLYKTGANLYDRNRFAPVFISLHSYQASGSSPAGLVTRGAGHPKSCGREHPDVSGSR